MLKSTPHGGKLVNRMVTGEARSEALKRAAELKKVELSEVSVSDLEMIASGAMSPLTGFLGKDDYECVVSDMRLRNGLVWSLPITLTVSKEQAASIREGEELALVELSALNNGRGATILAILKVEEKFTYDKTREAREVYKTTDPAHPGVARLLNQGDVCLGGSVTLLNHSSEQTFPAFRHDPAEMRRLFEARGWETVVGFQTRNPIHRAHEYLQKCALEVVDGLLVHPLVGQTKSDDVPADVRMRSYTVLLEKYFPTDRVMLAVFPAAMRYAGPREAIFHALARKNYGCTHFIVGRDHAGVGDYYGTYDAQKIFDQFSPEEIGITPLKFEHAFYCTRTQAMATPKTSPGTPEERIFLSGTKVREMLRNGTLPPPEFTRPEVAEILIQAMKPAS